LAFQITEGAGGDRSGVITGKTGREVISDVADTIVGELVSLNVQSNGLEGWKAHP
jgi:hypothetical protein